MQPEVLKIKDIARMADYIAEWMLLPSHTFAAGMELHPIPRGGIPVALAVGRSLASRGYSIHIAEPEPAFDVRFAHQWGLGDLVIDDIYDSGKTLAPYLEAGLECAVLLARNGEQARQYPNLHFASDMLGSKAWVVFPWESGVSGPEDAVVRLLQYLGLDPNKESLRDTPRRLLGWLADFKEDQELGSELTIFDGEQYDEMVLVRDIPFVSLCEHHLLPFTGQAAVAYIPQASPTVPRSALGATTVPNDLTPGPILGLSKLARIVMWRARRATVQERLTEEVRAAVAEAAGTSHAAVLVSASHSCMTLRGARAHGSLTVTSALSGAFRDNQATRAEFLGLARAHA